MPEDVTDILDQFEQEETSIALDRNLLGLLAQVIPNALFKQIEIKGLSDLTIEERNNIAIALMRKYNKVTHIFELVKAYGSTSQVEYHRAERAWERRENIAAKHEYEVAVNPFTGKKLSGDDHAPLVYANDPRIDVPAELQNHLIQVIDNCDERIVAGWMVG